MENVEELWKRDLRVPLDLAPIALWHLFDAPEPIENKVLPQSEEALGLDF